MDKQFSMDSPYNNENVPFQEKRNCKLGCWMKFFFLLVLRIFPIFPVTFCGVYGRNSEPMNLFCGRFRSGRQFMEAPYRKQRTDEAVPIVCHTTGFCFISELLLATLTAKSYGVEKPLTNLVQSLDIYRVSSRSEFGGWPVTANERILEFLPSRIVDGESGQRENCASWNEKQNKKVKYFLRNK